MVSEKGVSLEQRIMRILEKSEPLEDRKYLEQFLNNLRIWIKKARKEKLTEEEELYPDHPELSHRSTIGAPTAGDAHEHLLEIIDRYNITNIRRIISLAKSTETLVPFPQEIRLSSRMLKIIQELYKEPLLPNSKLAEQLSTSSRTIAKDISTLRNYYALRISNVIDPHKFKFAHLLVNFKTKSLQHSIKLERLFQGKWPVFLRSITFDEDYRSGWISYYLPDQPRCHNLFESRLRSLDDEFFEYHSVTRIHGMHMYISFDTYDPSIGTWLLQSHIVTEAMIKFIRDQASVIPPPRGFLYSKSMKFDRVDFLLSQLIAVTRPTKIDFIKTQLHRYGFSFSEKTIWTRLQRLKSEGAVFPILQFMHPAFADFVTIVVTCSKEYADFLQLLPSMLPFTYIYTLDHGLSLAFYQPANCTSIGGQLVRAFSFESGVEDILFNRTFRNIGTTIPQNAFDRWDESRQRWVIQDGDI